MTTHLERNLALLGLDHVDFGSPPSTQQGKPFSRTIIPLNDKDALHGLVILPGLDLSAVPDLRSFSRVLVFAASRSELLAYLSQLDLSQLENLKTSCVGCCDFYGQGQDLPFFFRELLPSFTPSLAGLADIEILAEEGLTTAQVEEKALCFVQNVAVDEPTLSNIAAFTRGRHHADFGASTVRITSKVAGKPTILFPCTNWSASGQFYYPMLGLPQVNALHIPPQVRGEKIFNETDLIAVLRSCRPDAMFMCNLNALATGSVLSLRLIAEINKRQCKVISFNFDVLEPHVRKLCSVLDPSLLYIFGPHLRPALEFKALGVNTFAHFYSVHPYDIKNQQPPSLDIDPVALFIGNVQDRSSLLRSLEDLLAGCTTEERSIAERLVDLAKSLRFTLATVETFATAVLPGETLSRLLYILGELQRGECFSRLQDLGLPLRIFGFPEGWRSFGIRDAHLFGTLDTAEGKHREIRRATLIVDFLRLWNWGSFNDRVLPSIMAGGLVAPCGYSRFWPVFTADELSDYETPEDLLQIFTRYTGGTGREERITRVTKAQQRARFYSPEKSILAMLSKAGVLALNEQEKAALAPYQG